MASSAFKIHGMDCAEEIRTLKAELGPVAGVQDLAFDLLQGKMTVTYAPEQVEPDDLMAAVARTGMRAEPFEQWRDEGAVGTAWDRWGRTITTTLGGILLALAFLTHALAQGLRAAVGGAEALSVPLAARALYVAAAAAGAWFVLPKAWHALRRLRPDMNLLMSIAVAGAIAIGEYFEAATVSFLFALSLALEAWSVGRARRAVAALIALTPNQARVIGLDGNEEMVGVETVPIGSRIVVKPGEQFPLDGRIAKGQTSANQAPITGESMPVPKGPGDEVFAGTINQDGAVEVETIKTAGHTTLAQIVRMVGQAHSRRAPSERWVETFARYYTPSVMALAVAVAVVPPLFLGNWAGWFYQALVLLVIACPCALVISTPVSIVAALTSAARHGVLIKGGLYAELPARLRAIAIDKTGTLTQGRPRVAQVVPLDSVGERELLEVAAAIERRSEHPLGRAIEEHAQARGIRPTPVESFQAAKGKGATAVLDGVPVWIGSHRYLVDRQQETPELRARIESLSSSGTSVVVVGREDRVLGLIAMADAVRPAARGAVAALKAAGIRHVVMLTGDNHPTAAAVAQATGVDEFRAELLPRDKVKAVEELLERYGTVAMVGDGVNDAPALARANLGIAMGAAGADAALEIADVALMSDDLAKLPWLVRHARRTLRIIHQNVVLSLAVKAAFVILTFSGHATLWAAIAADMGVSLLVVCNALRLLRDGRATAGKP